MEIPQWKEPKDVEEQSFSLGLGDLDKTGWGGYSPNERAFFHHVLPSIFSRTVVVDSVSGDRGLEWIFTGPREGIYLEITGKRLTFYRKYYDSYAFNIGKIKLPRYPQQEYHRKEIVTDKDIKAVTVTINYKLQLQILVNGRSVIDELIIEDFRRSQLTLSGQTGFFRGRMLSLAAVKDTVTISTANTFQTMLGWGGIGTPTAYRQLSEAGKEKWWDYIGEYNLLCQREYPVGGRLHKNLDNWDNINYAKAHYYGDNFPNGEVSDFEYTKQIQSLGGFVIFEFWDFPGWIGNNENEYTRAVVGYCAQALKMTGMVPRIVGIQNEIDMPEERIMRFVPALRKALDDAGFKEIKIHMANAPTLKAGLQRVNKYVNRVWQNIDYSATNMYDYQDFFTNPDSFDSTLTVWKNKTQSLPFLSTELCINDSKYQTDSYRMALCMGQLYQKNLVLANAELICYCWTILNTEQPSFGASRSLFISSAEDGFMPVPSGNQLRVFGAYSRRIKEGMRRVETKNGNLDLKVVAFEGGNNSATLVMLNRSLNPIDIEIAWKNSSFSEMEIIDPYSPNLIVPFKGSQVRIEPGSIVTLTNVPLNKHLQK